MIPTFDFKMSSLHQPSNFESVYKHESEIKVRRCLPPSIYPSHHNPLYTDDQIKVEMQWKDKDTYFVNSGFSSLNDGNTQAWKDAMLGKQGVTFDPMMPPPNYDKSYIMYTLNSDTLPNSYNGTRKDGGNLILDVQDIK